MARSLRPERHCGRSRHPTIALTSQACGVPVEPNAAIRLDHPPLRLGHYTANLDGIEFGPSWQHVEGKISSSARTEAAAAFPARFCQSLIGHALAHHPFLVVARYLLDRCV